MNTCVNTVITENSSQSHFVNMKAQYIFWNLSTESTVLVNVNTLYTKNKHMLIWKLLNFKIRQAKCNVSRRIDAICINQYEHATKTK